MTPLFISIIGALSAITVSILGAWYTNRNNIVLQTRKLKEDHYVSFIEALHDVTGDNRPETIKKYVFARDKMLIVANEEVIIKILFLEKLYDMEKTKANELLDASLTEIIIAIRKDLKIKDKNFPKVGFRKA